MFKYSQFPLYVLISGFAFCTCVSPSSASSLFTRNSTTEQEDFSPEIEDVHTKITHVSFTNLSGPLKNVTLSYTDHSEEGQKHVLADLPSVEKDQIYGAKEAVFLDPKSLLMHKFPVKFVYKDEAYFLTPYIHPTKIPQDSSYQGGYILEFSFEGFTGKLGQTPVVSLKPQS